MELFELTEIEELPTAKMPIKHPKTGVEIGFIEWYSNTHEKTRAIEFQRAQDDLLEMVANINNADKDKSEQLAYAEKKDIERKFKRVVSIGGLQLNGKPFELTLENFEYLLLKHPTIKIACNNFLSAGDSFLPEKPDAQHKAE